MYAVSNYVSTLHPHLSPTQILCAKYFKKNVLSLTNLITIFVCQIGQAKQTRYKIITGSFLKEAALQLRKK